MAPEKNPCSVVRRSIFAKGSNSQTKISTTDHTDNTDKTNSKKAMQIHFVLICAHPCASVAKIRILPHVPRCARVQLCEGLQFPKPRFRPRITQINTDKTKRTHHANVFVLIRAHPCDPWQKTNSFLLPARKAIPPKPILRRPRVRADKTRANLDHLVEFSLFHRPQNKMSLAQMLTTLNTLSSTKQNPTQIAHSIPDPAKLGSAKRLLSR